MRVFGLIGKKLTHSFSKRYFTEKFEKENIRETVYKLVELPSIDLLPQLIDKQENLKGLNVTIPYKVEILPFLHEIDPAAARIGAVNVVKISENRKLKGYNSDYYGFKLSLERFLEGNTTLQALILGTGGASKAVKIALEDLHIPYLSVSRYSEKSDVITYEQLNKAIFSSYPLIINTTPLGMYPQIDTCPPIPYHLANQNYYFYDLVYNPEHTLFMQKGAERGAKVKNGLEMLYLQAEKSWEIWNE